MARTVLGFTIGRSSELASATALEEALGDIRLAKRELEDISWRLLNPTSEQASSDMKPLDRAKVVERGILYWIKDPVVGQSLDMFADYVVGGGIEMPHTDNEELAKVLAGFWGDKSNKRVITGAEAQRQKVLELEIMGNVFPTAFVNEGTGHVKLSDIPPGEISEIIAHPEDRKRHVYYRRNYTPSKYDFAKGSWEAGETEVRYYCAAYEQPIDGYGPAAGDLHEGHVFHWSINRLSDGKFGNPRVARILDWVNAYNEFMRARVSMMRALAQFAWQRRVKGNAGDVRKIVDAHRAGHLGGGSASDPMGSGAVPAQYAATVTTNENVAWEQLKTDTGGAGAMQDGRMIKGQIGMGAGWPLHYLGDIGGANLATATAMELPVLKMIEGRQGYVRSCLEEIIDFAIVKAIEKGELKPAPTGMFSAERLGIPWVAPDTEGSVQIDEAEGEDLTKVLEAALDPKKTNKGSADDRSIYEYNIVMPSILKRQTSEVINAVTNLLKTIDPYSQNVDASRWALRFSLEVMEVPNPQTIVDTIFPPGYEYPTFEVERGRTDTRPNDGRGQADFQAARKPPAESRVGAKGGKEARQPGEIETSTTEANPMARAEGALLDLIDSALDRMDADGVQ